MIRDGFRHERLRRQYARVETSIRNKASLASDMTFHQTMVDFYTDRVSTTDPNVDWWGFAEAKQKQVDNQEDIRLLSKRLAEADATVKAHKEAFYIIKRESDEILTSN